MRLSWFGGAMLALHGLAVQAQTVPADELARRSVERRATEAMIWAMPAVNTDLMLQEALSKTKAKPNDIVFWSQPVNWKNQTLTPNPDSIYFMSFWNVKDGPVVIQIPPAKGGSIAGNIVTIWQMPLEDAGPEGADRGKGGKYLITPPGYKGRVPAGYFHLPSDSYSGFALLRANLPSHSAADIAKSVAYGKQVRIYPLSRAASPPATNFVDAYDVMFDSTIKYDASFYRNLDRVVQNEPWLQRDRAMIDQLKTLGIEKGSPSPQMRRRRTLSRRAPGKPARCSRSATRPGSPSSTRVSAGFQPRCQRSSRRSRTATPISTSIPSMRAA